MFPLGISDGSLPSPVAKRIVEAIVRAGHAMAKQALYSLHLIPSDQYTSKDCL